MHTDMHGDGHIHTVTHACAAQALVDRSLLEKGLISLRELAKASIFGGGLDVSCLPRTSPNSLTPYPQGGSHLGRWFRLDWCGSALGDSCWPHHTPHASVFASTMHICTHARSHERAPTQPA